MDKVTSLKMYLLTFIGSTGSLILNLLGGWDMALQTLMILMALDYVTGLIVAGVFNNSNKTKTGALESKAGWKGLCRKGMTLVIVLVGAQLDKMTGTDLIRNAVIIGYAANEAISITENAGLMGLPIPNVIKKAIDILKQKADEKEGE